MRLPGKIISAFALVSLLPLILMSVLLYLFVNSSTEEHYMRQSESALAAFRFHFDDHLMRLERDANQLTGDSEFLVNALDLPKREAELTALLETYLARDEFQFAVIQMNEPPALFKVFQDGLGSYVGMYQPTPLSADGGSNAGVVRLSEQHGSSLAVTVSVPVYFRDQIAGELTVGIMLSTLIEHFPLAAANLSGILVTANGQGLYAATPDSLLRANIAQIAAVRSAESIWQASVQNRNYFIQESEIVGINGQIVASIEYIFDQSDRDENRARLLRVFVALAAASVVLAVLLGYFFQRALSKPIAEMALSAKRIAGGEAPNRIHYYSDDEIGDLVAGINRLSDDLRDTEIRLRRSEQVAAWQMFARQTAHEIRNFLMPLATTAAQLERWSQSGDVSQERAAEISHSIQTEIQRMKHLLGAFSEFARMPAPELKLTSLTAIIAEIRNDFSEEIALGRIHLESNGASGTLNCDASQIRQVLLNLIKNSFEGNASVVELRIHNSDQKMLFEICDDGCGIDQSRGIDPFTPLYTTKERGSGLGLAICRRIIVDHGGDITCAANPTRGMTFTFYLPIEA